jgi:dihydroflavonol-4-reductase
MKKVFITGATGFLGSNLTRRLVENGDDVTILVRKGSDHPFLKNLDVKKAEGDVSDFESLKNGIKGMDLVYHCAGVVSYCRADKDLMDTVNIQGTENVCNAALEGDVGRLLYVSSTAAIGIPEDPRKPADESSPFHKKWLNIPYMRSKKIAEEKALSYVKNGLDIVAANPSTFYGAGDIKVSTGEVFRKINSGILRSAPPGGNGVIAVTDCVEGIIMTAEKGKTGERYIFNSENLTFLEIFKTIAETLHKPPINQILPRWLGSPASVAANAMRIALPFLGIEPPISPELIKISWNYRYFDSSKARKDLNWQPNVPFKQACHEAAEFYKTIRAL